MRRFIAAGFVAAVAATIGCGARSKVDDPSTILDETCGTRPFGPSDAASGCEADGRFYDLGCDRLVASGVSASGMALPTTSGECERDEYGSPRWFFVTAS